MATDPAKARARKRRYLDRKKAEKYGPDAVGRDLRGRHGNHARGQQNARWNRGRMLSSHGYVLVRVGRVHPLAFGNGYAYEHDIVWVSAGRPAPGPDELVHHRNEDKTDDRLENLELLTRAQHAEHHSEDRERDELGRFAGQMPERGLP